MAAIQATPQPLFNADAIPDDVDLLVLFGSRAKGNHTATSDWDLGVRFRPDPRQPLPERELMRSDPAPAGAGSPGANLSAGQGQPPSHDHRRRDLPGELPV